MARFEAVWLGWKHKIPGHATGGAGCLFRERACLQLAWGGVWWVAVLGIVWSYGWVLVTYGPGEERGGAGAS